MKTAVAAGFSDDRDLQSSPVYTPLRGRDDFERLVRELILRRRILWSEILIRRAATT